MAKILTAIQDRIGRKNSEKGKFNGAEQKRRV